MFRCSVESSPGATSTVDLSRVVLSVSFTPNSPQDFQSTSNVRTGFRPHNPDTSSAFAASRLPIDTPLASSIIFHPSNRVHPLRANTISQESFPRNLSRRPRNVRANLAIHAAFSARPGMSHAFRMVSRMSFHIQRTSARNSH